MTIFARLVASYLILFFLLFVVSAYAIFQFGKVEGVVRSVILNDFHLLDLHKKLTDSVLSQSRYEKKYLIIQDRALYDGFLQASADFDRYLKEATLYADDTALKEGLEGLKADHHRYNEILGMEVALISSGTGYAASTYRGEKEELVTRLLERLRSLRAGRQDDILKEILNLGEAGSKSRRFATVITIVFVLLGVVLSALITRSITGPLSRMKLKTREIAAGNFEGHLELVSPPEIGDLAHALNVMSDKLHEVDKMKTDFFSLMSHELRTPLTSIKEGTHLLLDGMGGETTDKQKRLLSIIAEESNRLINLVSSLLDLSKMEAGMLAYNFVVKPLPPLVDKAVTELVPLAAARNLWIEKEVGHLPPVTIDEERILQVLRNLMGNAIKFSQEGGILTISATATDEGVLVSIKDRGLGIAPEHLDTIFDKFSQATMTGTNKLQGTGLGLAVVKHIVNAHGGRVWAESVEGTGSTFSFVLPV